MKSLREVYRIGYGPSSSHTMGPRRAAEIFCDRERERNRNPDRNPEHDRECDRGRERRPAVERSRVTLYGSLSATGKAHMTDRAVAQGLTPIPTEFVWSPETHARHPNALRFEALDAGGGVLDDWLVFSVGGGALEDENGPVDAVSPAAYPAGNIAECLQWCEERNKPFWSLPAETEPDVADHLAEVWSVMRDCVGRGLESSEAVLPGGLSLPRKAEAAHARAQSLGGVMRDMSLLATYALAVAEENGAGGKVVTAPTCGAAGVLPAVLYYFRTDQKVGERPIIRALLTAGLFGASVSANGSVAGAEVGCQGEIGTGCAMAAAAAAQLLGGSPRQVEYAAEMALEHHLGLTCDPVLGLVQIPCIERNAFAAMRALDCATYALLGDGRHVISFDEVVEVMVATGRDLQAAYRETASGGLAEVWEKRRRRLGTASDEAASG
ncbi:MAG: serine dehydratase [Bradyrhizobium sp.]|nr:serine dehydratase [Bradyrhizobium sp.]